MLYVVEEIAGNCGIRNTLAYELSTTGSKIRVCGKDLGNQYVQHGALDTLYEHYGLSGEEIAKSIMEVIRSEN